MDINQSSSSSSKLNKPGIARSASENNAIAKANKSKEVQPASPITNGKQTELSEGQTIKGQIIDHRYNEIKIQLEPSKQIITAKLLGDVPLAIGQNAQFIITEDGLDRLVLKYLPESLSPSEVTIQKALSASGLPMNDRNKTIVEELLRHTLPVDKQTLQNLVRISHRNPEATPLTLVLMFKNNIPMTVANIRQFEAYQSGTSRLLNDIQSITKGLSELITPNYTEGSPGQDTGTITKALQVNHRMLDLLLSNSKQTTPTVEPVVSDLNSLLASPKQGTISLEATSDLIKANYPDIAPLLSDELGQPLSSTSNEIQSPITSDLKPLPELLNPRERASLADLLRSMPSLRPIADAVMEGTIPTRELLVALQHNLPQLEAPIAESLLASPPYQTLLETAFHDKWTITPEKLTDKAALQELYDNLREDIEQLSALAKLEVSIKEEAKLQAPAKNLQENLRFMQDLNEMYTYLQLPVQLKNQDVHSELFVFTRKKALQNKEDLSVLLHLDMTKLGSMNIHIRMNHNNVQAKFYIENQDAQRLISEHMPSLTESLMNKGYRLHSEVTRAYEKPDFSRDFIEDQITEGEVKRYTFDIRT